VKKSEYKALLARQRAGDTPKGGWGRYKGNWHNGAGAKLSRKAAEGKL
jgi:hypothetical protein